MEVEVLGVSGIPEDAIISIRAGSARRQAPVSALGTNGMPFKFAAGSAGLNPFKVDVLQPVGSARLALRPSGGTYTVPIKSNNAPGVSVLVNVKETKGAKGKDTAQDVFDRLDANKDGKISRSEIAGIVRKGDDDKPMLQPLDGGLGIPISPSGMEKLPPLQTDADGRFPAAATAAKDFLDKHKLLPFVRALLQTVVRDRPADPYNFIAEQFRSAIPASLPPDSAVSKPPVPSRPAEYGKQLPPRDSADVAKQLPGEAEYSPPPGPTAYDSLPFNQLPSAAPFMLSPKASKPLEAEASTAAPLLGILRFSQLPSAAPFMLLPTPPEPIPLLHSLRFNQLPSATPFVLLPKPLSDAVLPQDTDAEALSPLSPKSLAEPKEAVHDAFHSMAAQFGIDLSKMAPEELEAAKEKAHAALAALVKEATIEITPLSDQELEAAKQKAKDALIRSATQGVDLKGDDLKDKAQDLATDKSVKANVAEPVSVVPDPPVEDLATAANVAEPVNVVPDTPVEDLQDAKEMARDALKQALIGAEEEDDEVDLKAAKLHAKQSLVNVILGSQQREADDAPEVEDTRLKDAALADGDEEIEDAKAKARNALTAALMEDGTALEGAKAKARAALAATLIDDDEDMDDAKSKARAALEVALMDDDADIDESKASARAALEAALLDSDSAIEDAKAKARAALAASLIDDDADIDDAKTKARAALEVFLMDDDAEVDTAKEKARDALEAALMYDGADIEDAKAKARAALSSALADDDGDVEEAKAKARAALRAALAEDDEDVEAAKSKARAALTAALMDDDSSIEEVKEKAREALDASMLDDDAKIDLAKKKARKALAATLIDDADIEEAKQKARDALNNALYESDVTSEIENADDELEATTPEEMKAAKNKARQSLIACMLGGKPLVEEDLPIQDAKDAPIENAKDMAREALTTALFGNDVETAKANAREAVESALFGDDMAKAKARDAMETALLDDEEEVAEAKALASEALGKALLGDDMAIVRAKTAEALADVFLDTPKEEQDRESTSSPLEAVILLESGGAEDAMSAALVEGVIGATEIPNITEEEATASNADELEQQKSKLIVAREEMAKQNNALKDEVIEMNNLLVNLMSERDSLRTKVQSAR